MDHSSDSTADETEPDYLNTYGHIGRLQTLLSKMKNVSSTVTLTRNVAYVSMNSL